MDEANLELFLAELGINYHSSVNPLTIAIYFKKDKDGNIVIDTKSIREEFEYKLRKVEEASENGI